MNINFNVKKMGLHNKLAIVLVLLIALQTLLLGAFSITYLEQRFEQNKGEKALSVAQTLAQNPIIITALNNRTSSTIQNYVEPIRKQIGASFIVVGDRNGIRFSHPNINKINLPMKGGDSIRALTLGESYTSKAMGSLGESIRGKTPVLNNSGDIIGLISVGYLSSEISQSIALLRNTFASVFGLFILAGGALAYYISKRYRDEIFGLEPEEISRVYSERKAVLESILDGLVVIDETGIITGTNNVALQLLGNVANNKIVGNNVQQLLPDYYFLFSTESEKSWRDVEIKVNNNTLIMTKTPLFIEHNQRGVVVSFRRKDDIVELSNKLSQVEQYSTMLRAQTHEYSNKLNTIGGLIQIGSYDEALELIVVESSGYQELIAFVMKTIPEPIIAGLIIGKYDVAKERNIELILDEESSLEKIPKRLNGSLLVTILGNILENAFDASIANLNKKAQVKVSVTDIGPDLIFEIEDSGLGMSDESIANVFTLGHTTKSDIGHGFGMYLVKKSLDQANGHLAITRAKTGGTIMTVYIPKRLGENNEN